MTDDWVAEEAERFRDEDGWPCWPLLPVKRTTGYEVGVVVAGELNVVYRVNWFELRKGPLDEQLKDVPKTTYDTTEQLIAAGWIGD